MRKLETYINEKLKVTKGSDVPNLLSILDSTNRKNVLRAMVLASVKNLVQSLNGIVWVESQILKNTSFNIIIPSN